MADTSSNDDSSSQSASDSGSASDPESEQIPKIIKKRIRRSKRMTEAEKIDKVQARRKIRKRTKIVRTKALRKIMAPVKNIGVDVRQPPKSCEDRNCPFHGQLPVRGQIIDGTVLNAKMDKTVVIQKIRRHYIPKYERYEKRTSRYFAHNPPCINAQRGDMVRIMECRPLSKKKSFVVVERGV